MRVNKGVGLLLMLAVIFGIALIDAGVKPPIRWDNTFNFEDKIPFGLYVFKQEAVQIFKEKERVSTLAVDYEEALDSTLLAGAEEFAIIDIAEYFYTDHQTTPLILDFVNNGGEMFIACSFFEEDFLDSLGIQVDELDYNTFRPSDWSVQYSVGLDTAKIKLDKVGNFNVFSKLDANTCAILGNVHARGVAMPNFIKIQFGKGNFYLHTLPELYSNYHMLQLPAYLFASKALQVVENKNILLYDNYYFSGKASQTPLRVLLTKPGLMQAWYILLIGLFLLLAFKSKREQRAVEVVLPEPNMSKEFAKTIATLYYEDGEPWIILTKKIEYFLYSIRTTYGLHTNNVLDERFIKQLAAKSTVGEVEVLQLMQIISVYRQEHHCTVDDVKRVNKQIDEFKKKANL